MDTPMFEVEQSDSTVIVVPQQEMGQIEFQAIEQGAATILDLLNQPGVQNVVVDLSRTNYVGTTALGFFVKLWRVVSSHEGTMAMCCVSDYEMEVLQTMKLDTLWSIHGSREEALAAVAG